MTEKSILILGVGNLLLSDEGVGVHIAQRLQKMSLPAEIEVIDGGTAGFELIHYCRGKSKVIIVDAVMPCRGRVEPGTVLRFTGDELALTPPLPYSAHQAGLQELLASCKQLQPRPEIVIYGIVSEETREMGTQLSKTVERRLDEVVSLVLHEAGVIAAVGK